MNLEQVEIITKGIPFMSREEGERLARLIEKYDLKCVLELGFKHGVSSCYIVSALHSLKRGHLTTIDKTSVKNCIPNIEALLDRLGLSDYVTIYYEPTSYLWRLMRMIEKCDERFDLCYLDGAHDWFTDGFAFFLIDRLLMPGGWIVFDDMNWTFNRSPKLKTSARVKVMPVDEASTPQIRKIYELLVKTHPDYDSFFEKDGWGYARKKMNK